MRIDIIYQSLMNELLLEDKRSLMTKFWTKRGTLNLPNDEQKLQNAIKYAERYKLDFQKFNSPDQLINSINDRIAKSTAKDVRINPNNVEQFFNKVIQDDGIVTYWVKDNKSGQIAVRKIVDQYLGYDSNPWCIIARNEGFIRRHQEQLQNMSEEQKQKLGFYSDDELKIAWGDWKNYSSIPKRIAFKNGQLYAFSANDKQIIVWWDIQDKKYEGFPNSNIHDKDTNGNLPQLIIEQEKIKHIKNDKLIDNEIEQIVHYGSSEQILYLIKNNQIKIPSKLINKIIDVYPNLITILIRNRNDITLENLNRILDSIKLSHATKFTVKKILAQKQQLPIEILRKLANDNNLNVREYLTKRKNLPQEIIEKLANDKI